MNGTTTRFQMSWLLSGKTAIERELSVANIPVFAINCSLVSESWQRHFKHIGVARKMSPYLKRNSFKRGVVKSGDRSELQAEEQTSSSSSGLL